MPRLTVQKHPRNKRDVYTLELRGKWWELLERLAKEQQMTKSEVVRRALDAYAEEART